MTVSPGNRSPLQLALLNMLGSSELFTEELSKVFDYCEDIEFAYKVRDMKGAVVRFEDEAKAFAAKEGLDG